MVSQLTRNARLVALCIVDTAWNLPALTERLTIVLAGGPPDPQRLVARLLFHCEAGRSPSFQRIVDVLEADVDFVRHHADAAYHLQPGAATMQPLPDSLVTFPLPTIPTLRHLATWLGLSDRELAWFCGGHRRYTTDPNPVFHHYRYHWQDRCSGIPRLIEQPKPKLKALQREVLRNILDRVPPHDAAHGFRRHRSCLTGATPHTGQATLLRMDLQDFFTSINRARVAGVFRILGYPAAVATALAGLCTNRSVLKLSDNPIANIPWQTRKKLEAWHLPQGAPTSPALANLCAWRLDSRLTGLAAHWDANFTRYADDLALSGGRQLRKHKSHKEALIAAIVLEEGFRINHRKTRWSTSAQRQRYCGVVVNRHANVERAEYDRLKAILNNCVRHGPVEQNRAEHPDFRRHLQGRISHVAQLNPARGNKLSKLFDRIHWPQ